ncbi:MAG: SDR family oxidoreductase [Gammaproteobacteria bacterium]
MAQAALIFGATRGTGLETARALTGQGLPVTAAVRESSDTAELDAIGAKTMTVDIFNTDSVKTTLETGVYDAVILSLSGKKGEEPRPDREGVKLIMDVARECGVSRVLMVTAIGTGNSRPAVAPKVIEILGPVLEAKTIAEDYLIESGLDYTILRPGGLTDDPASGTAIRSEEHKSRGVATRADVGRLVAECLGDDSTIGQIYHTIDPEIKWQPPLQRGEDLPKK